jgi:hypothetical protein
MKGADDATHFRGGGGLGSREVRAWQVFFFRAPSTT